MTMKYMIMMFGEAAGLMETEPRVDVENEARAVEISSQIATYAGVVELRQVAEAPPEV